MCDLLKKPYTKNLKMPNVYILWLVLQIPQQRDEHVSVSERSQARLFRTSVRNHHVNKATHHQGTIPATKSIERKRNVIKYIQSRWKSFLRHSAGLFNISPTTARTRKLNSDLKVNEDACGMWNMHQAFFNEKKIRSERSIQSFFNKSKMKISNPEKDERKINTEPRLMKANRLVD